MILLIFFLKTTTILIIPSFTNGILLYEKENNNFNGLTNYDDNIVRIKRKKSKKEEVPLESTPLAEPVSSEKGGPKNGKNDTKNSMLDDDDITLSDFNAVNAFTNMNNGMDNMNSMQGMNNYDMGNMNNMGAMPMSNGMDGFGMSSMGYGGMMDPYSMGYGGMGYGYGGMGMSGLMGGLSMGMGMLGGMGGMGMMGMGGYGMGMMDPMMMSGMGGGMMPGMMPGMYGGNTMGMQGIDSDSFGQGGFRHSMHTGKKDSDGDGIPDDMDPEPLRPQSSTALNRQGTNGTQNSGTNRWKSAGQQVIAKNRLRSSLNGTAQSPLQPITNKANNGLGLSGTLKRKNSIFGSQSSIKRKFGDENVPHTPNINGQSGGTGSISPNPGNTPLSNGRRNSSASLFKHRGSIRGGRRPSLIGHGGSFRRPMFPGRRSSLFRRNSIG